MVVKFGRFYREKKKLTATLMAFKMFIRPGATNESNLSIL